MRLHESRQPIKAATTPGIATFLSASAIVMASNRLFDSNLAGHHFSFDGALDCNDASNTMSDSALEVAGALQAFANATSPQATDALMCHVLQARRLLMHRATRSAIPPPAQPCIISRSLPAHAHQLYVRRRGFTSFPISPVPFDPRGVDQTRIPWPCCMHTSVRPDTNCLVPHHRKVMITLGSRSDPTDGAA